MKTTLTKNTKYQADIFLSALEQFATNDMIKSKLTQVGFKDVVVSGTGKSRNATGIWPGETVTADIPTQVKSIKEI
ncbi:MAG: hypothetical protein ACK5OS_01920 [Chryseotalea sp.]|jgi:hypothetical protein